MKAKMILIPLGVVFLVILFITAVFFGATYHSNKYQQSVQISYTSLETSLDVIIFDNRVEMTAYEKVKTKEYLTFYKAEFYKTNRSKDRYMKIAAQDFFTLNGYITYIKKIDFDFWYKFQNYLK